MDLYSDHGELANLVATTAAAAATATDGNTRAELLGAENRSVQRLARVEQRTKICGEPGRWCSVGDPVVDGDRHVHDIPDGDSVVDNPGLG